MRSVEAPGKSSDSACAGWDLLLIAFPGLIGNRMEILIEGN